MTIQNRAGGMAGIWMAAIAVLLLATSARNIWRHFDKPWPIAFAFAALLGAGLYALNAIDRRPGFLRRTLHSKELLYVLAAAVGIVGYLLYRRVDGLGTGSTSDDAFMLPIQALVAGKALYGVQLFDGAPISPGPGWLLLNLPFGSTFLHAWLTPFYCVASTRAFARAIGDNNNLPLVSCMAVPIFWTLAGSGSDLVALGFALPLCLLLVENHLRDNASVLWLALLVGTLTTARIVFSPVPILIGLLFLKKDRALAIRFAIAATLVNGIWHGIFFACSDPYPPLHLFNRGAHHVGFDLMAIGGVAALLLAGLLVRWCGNDFGARLRWFAGVLALVLAVVALGELRTVRYDPAEWEGANYLFVAVPALMFAIYARPFAASSAASVHREADAGSKARASEENDNERHRVAG